MRYYTIPPPDVLKNYVRFFWVLESDAPSYVHRSMATACPELLFHYTGVFDELHDSGTEKSFTSGIAGQTGRVRRFHINGGFGIFGAYLYPYAIKDLFGHPVNLLTDQMPSTADLLGNEGKMLEELMMLASDNHTRLKILSNFLSGKLPHVADDRLHEAIRFAINRPHDIDIQELAATQCLSRRQFERRFKERSGFSPRKFTRIARFQSVFDKLSGKNPTLTEVAYDLGYYDQSHFIHEFRQFSGFNPTEFLKRDGSEKIIWSEMVPND